VLVVDGLPWAISCTRRPPTWVIRGRGEKILGYCDREARRIWLCSLGAVEDRLSTLAHELLHVMLPDASERDVGECEARFYSLLRDNDLGWFRERTPCV
jgi:uncharacterized protein YfaQ (DUF2300 family)